MYNSFPSFPQYSSFYSVIPPINYCAYQPGYSNFVPSAIHVYPPKNEAPKNDYAVICQRSDKLCVLDEQNNLHLVFDSKIDQLYFVNPDKLYNRDAFYIVIFRNNPQPVIIPEKDFYSSKKFLNLLSSGCHKSPILYKKSERKTAELLRLYFSSIANQITIRFYYGWIPKDNGWYFCLCKGKTHGMRPLHISPNEVSIQSERLSITATSSLYSTEQFVSLMETITTDTTRGLLFLWLHASALYSLLTALGSRLPLGLCLFTTKAQPYQILKYMLEWHNDSVINLAEDADHFLNCLVERKDQPMFLYDNGSKPANVNTLLQIIQTGNIPLATNSMEQRPLQALPVVISSVVSPLTVSHQFLTLDLTFCDFSEDAFDRASNLNKYLPDYICGFSAFIENHIDDLLESLSNGSRKALKAADKWEISNEGTSALCILYCISDMVKAYYKNLAPQSTLRDRLKRLIPADWDTTLLKMLQFTADCGEGLSDLAATFMAIAKKKLCRGDFEITSRDGQPLNDTASPGQDGIVYVDNQFYSFTRTAFSSVCRACDASGPMVISALRDADLLKGASVNNTTAMTRITVCDVYGLTHSERVYKFEKATLYLSSDDNRSTLEV